MRKQVLASLIIGTSAMLTLPVVAMADKARNHSDVEIGLTGGWFAPDTSTTNFALKREDNDTRNAFPSGDVLRNDPKYRFGGGISVSGSCDCCYVWSASYFWFHSKSHEEDTAPNTAPFVFTPLLASQDGVFDNVSDVESDYHFRYDFANIELGSVLCVISDCLAVKPKIGLSYSRIKNEQEVEYSRGDVPAGAVYTVDLESRYNGVGPSIGADVMYSFCGEWSIMGNFRYSALLGSLKADWEFSTTGVTPLGPNTNPAEVEFHSKRHFVKLFQSELALGYNFDWCGNCALLMAGWQFTQALDSKEVVNFAAANGRDFFRMDDRIVNSSYQGPFVRLVARFGM